MSNSLESLPNNAFGCLGTNLRSLTLSSNRHIQIPVTAFPTLSNLLELYLIDCGLSNPNPSWFRAMQSLVELHLESNGIRSLPDGIFSVSTRLANVYLSMNSFTELTAAPFGGNVGALEVVSLIRNSVSRVDPNFFDSAVNLRSLYLSGNVCISENFEISSSNRNSVRQQLESCF